MTKKKEERLDVDKEVARRRYCVECRSDADVITERTDSEYEYFHCKKCGLEWRHRLLPKEQIVKKGHLQSQMSKLDSLIHESRGLVEKYPNDLALRLNLGGLLGHRRVLLIAIEMVHSPIPFEDIDG
jgi:ribosomal protein S26